MLNRIVETTVFCGMAFCQASVYAQDHRVNAPPFIDLKEMPSTNKSTVVGGDIQSVDPVLDRLVLKVVGQRPMRILFDERTDVFLDGKIISLRDLEPGRHVSIQTALDGTDIFAISIHMLSQAPTGECEGEVLSFDPATRELAINTTLSNEPVKLTLGMDTVVVREGQPSFSSSSSGLNDIVRGALVSIQFEAHGNGLGMARRIAVLAVPGSVFVFSGTISLLDMHSGKMVLSDPQNGRSYRIFFDPNRFAISETLRQGAQIRATANYDGTRYIAIAMDAN